jgi:small-conductance mechanosensitive channel
MFMRSKKMAAVFLTFVVFSLFTLACAPCHANDNDQGTAENSGSDEADLKIEEAHIDVQDALTREEIALKQLEAQRKEIEIYREKAEIEKQEAEIAWKEVGVIKETTKDRNEIKEALESAKKEQKEAEEALKKLAISEEKLLASQKKTEAVGKEALLAKERADILRSEDRKRLKSVYLKAIKTGIILGVGYLIMLLVVGMINRRVKDLKLRHLLRKNTVYALNVVIIVSIFYVWAQHMQSLTIFLSAIGAGVALALHEVILCVAGWITILIRKPFEVGDRIEFGGVKGDVIDFRMLSTSMLEIGNWVDSDQSTGRIVEVPNGNLFKMPCFNYSRGFEFIWNEIKIMVTFESDWKKAKDIMLKHANDEAKDMEDIVKRKINKMTLRYMIFFDKLTPVVYTDIKDSGIELTLRYLTEALKRRTSQDSLCGGILEDFEKEKSVHFAYTTYRIVRQ